MSKIVLSTILLVFVFCNNENKVVDKEEDQEVNVSGTPNRYKSPTNKYRLDSLFIVETVYGYIDKRLPPFDFYSQLYNSLSKININVDTIFFSQDRLKLFSFIIITIKDKNNSYKNVGNGLIGYRNSINEKWNIFNFNQFTPVGFRKYNSVRKLFREYYLGDGEFKTDTHSYWNSIDGKYQSIPFGYCLDDPLFWDSSIVWKKGFPLRNYYPFEVKDQAKPDEEDIVIVLPNFNYSDSILKMYNLK